jgi:hypothetical protein
LVEVAHESSSGSSFLKYKRTGNFFLIMVIIVEVSTFIGGSILGSIFGYLAKISLQQVGFLA